MKDIDFKNLLKDKFSLKIIFIIFIMLICTIFLFIITNNKTVKYVESHVGKVSAQEEKEYINRVYIETSKGEISTNEDDYSMLEVHVITNDEEDLGNVGTINYFQTSTDGGSIEIQDNTIKGNSEGNVQLYVTVDYNGSTYTSNTMDITVVNGYEIEYSEVTLYDYDADALFRAGGSSVGITQQGLYFTDGKIETTIGEKTFITSDWNRYAGNIDGYDENTPYKGLVQNELDENGNIQFTKEDYGIFEDTPSEGNVGLPFVKDDNGFYLFDSSKYEVYFQNGEAQSNTNLQWSNNKVTYEGGYKRIFSI